jgi:hypothetical protein
VVKVTTTPDPQPELDEALLALDDVKRRDDLPDWWRPASHALDEYLLREHGKTCGHNGLGLLLALLDREGYQLVPKQPPPVLRLPDGVSPTAEQVRELASRSSPSPYPGSRRGSGPSPTGGSTPCTCWRPSPRSTPTPPCSPT